MIKLFSLANPTRFARFSRPLLWLCSLGSLALFGWGLYLALIASPPDYLQNEMVRMMYIHVPAAWISMMCYSTMAVAALSFIIWKHTLAGLYLRAAAPIGAVFTAICLITGSLWGKPTWGAWWIWDARLTSVLILFFMYLGIMALSNAFEQREKSERAAAWMTLIGIVNLPIIKFSVEWWNTLHQSASISSLSRMGRPALAPEMMTPLLVMAAAYLFLFTVFALLRLESEILSRRLESRLLRRGHA